MGLIWHGFLFRQHYDVGAYWDGFDKDSLQDTSCLSDALQLHLLWDTEHHIPPGSAIHSNNI